MAQIKAPGRALWRFGLLASLLSGFSALVYQSLWLRGFSLAFGGTSASMALVLAVFMAGLALGSAIARRLHMANSLKAYALAEASMGLGALAAQALLAQLPALVELIALRLGPESQVLSPLKAVLAMLTVLPCAIAAGLSIPLLMEALERSGEPELRSFSRLYTFNTLGAAAGALAAAFFLIPLLGTHGAAATAAFLNLSLALMAWRLSISVPSFPKTTPVPQPSSISPRLASAAALSGAAAFVAELVWTRSLSLTLGSSAYAFAIMLASVLLGMALGAATYARFEARLDRRMSALLLFSGTLLLAAAILASSYALGRLPELYFAFMRVAQPSFGIYQCAGFFLALLCLLPVSAGMGFLFPLMLRLFAGEGGRRDSGDLYFCNTLGGVLGALAAGIIFLPKWGIQANFAVAAALCGTSAALLMPRPATWRAAFAVVALALGVCGVKFWRPWNGLVATSGVFQTGISLAAQFPASLSFRTELLKEYRLDSYEEGAEAVVAVRSHVKSGERSLLINGKVDASLQGDRLTQTLLAHLPLSLRPEAKNALIIGWGSGCTAKSAALHPLAQINCVEIEPEVYKTAPLFYPVSDSRLHLRFSDARQDLLTHPTLYDVIISEPSNPYISGVANLYTEEFYKLASRRLAPGGLYCQWFHLYSLDSEDIRRQLRTFSEVFSKSSLWLVPRRAGDQGISGDVILLGSETEPDLQAPAFIQRLESPAITQDLAQADCCGPLDDPASPRPRDRWWLQSLRLLGDAQIRQFSGPGSLNSDSRPRLEFSAPHSLFRSMHDQIASNLELFHALEASAVTPEAPGPALAQLGHHYSQRFLYHRAINALLQAESLGQKSPRLNLDLGRAYFFLRQSLEAEARLDSAFAKLPKEYAMFLSQGTAFQKLGRPDLALEIFEMALKAKPGDLRALAGRDSALKAKGHK